MKTSCLKCRKVTESKNAKVLKTSKGKVLNSISKYAVCDNKIITIYQKIKSKGLIRSLKIKTPWVKFYCSEISCFNDEKIL